MNYFFSYSILNRILTSEIFIRSLPKDKEKSDILKFNASLKLLDVDINSSEIFSYNRYLIDSINVKEIPNFEVLSELASKKYFLDHQNNLSSIAGNNSKKSYKEILYLFISKYFPDLVEILKGSGLKKDIKGYLDELSDKGFTVIPNLISEDKCDQISQTIKNYSAFEAKNKNAFFYGSKNNLQRIYHLLHKLPELNFLLLLPEVKIVMSECFQRNTLHDKYYLASWHANIIPHLGEAQKEHIDAAVPDPVPPWIIRMNANFIIQDYKEENGATLVLPKSHKYCRKPNQNEMKENYVPVIAPKGSVVFWNGHLWHKSGTNKTKENRIALLACYAASHLKEMCLEEDNLRIYAMRKIIPPDELKILLGFDHGIKSGFFDN